MRLVILDPRPPQNCTFNPLFAVFIRSFLLKLDNCTFNVIGGGQKQRTRENTTVLISRTAGGINVRFTNVAILKPNILSILKAI